MMKKTMFLLLVLTVVHDPAQRLAHGLALAAGALPPEYLSIPHWKDCVVSHTEDGNTYSQYCVPDVMPSGCQYYYTWKKLMDYVIDHSDLCRCDDLHCYGEHPVDTWDCQEFPRYYMQVCIKDCDESYCGASSQQEDWACGMIYNVRVCMLWYGMADTKNKNVFQALSQVLRSSSRSELSCPSNHTNTAARRDEEVLKSIGSAEECSTKCREKTTCKFWSWANKNKGQYSLDCVLVSGYGNTVRDDNVMSGPRTCHPQN